jgi:integrase
MMRASATFRFKTAVMASQAFLTAERGFEPETLYLLIILGVNTALRSVDFLGLRWAEVFDFENDRFRSHIVLTESECSTC